VLIPRPETELLVEAAVARVPRGGRVVDVGTGSGCIAVTLSLERRDLRLLALDLSIEALLVARTNARTLGAPVHFAASDLLTAAGAFDVVVSNPPYIASDDVHSLEKQVRDFEPRIALTPGPQGTEAISRILGDAQKKPVLMEIGFGQAELVREVAAAHRYDVDAILDDLAGIPRVVVLSSAW
jgi:release factor glutamine methyltransferase